MPRVRYRRVREQRRSGFQPLGAGRAGADFGQEPRTKNQEQWNRGQKSAATACTVTLAPTVTLADARSFQPAFNWRTRFPLLSGNMLPARASTGPWPEELPAFAGTLKQASGKFALPSWRY